MIARDKTAAILAAVAAMSPQDVARYHALLADDYQRFTPRPNNVAEWDEQRAFCEAFYRLDGAGSARPRYVYPNRERFWVCLGGTGSGKTQAAAWRVARHVREIPPPRPRTPFWVVGESFDQICQIAWVEKLSRLIPDDRIAARDWYRVNRRWPLSIMLKHPTIPGEIGWVLEFKSYAQGLSGMKGVSVGGYWCNEELPYHLVAEIQGRCREYDSPGWADFTPVECRDPEWIDAYENPPEGWRFFHLNSLLNTALAPGFMERFLATVPEELRPMRTIGKFTVLSGAVFKEFRRSIHVCEPFEIPRDWRKVRGIDFGWNNPLAVVWCAKDHDGNWFVYDEHYRSQTLLAEHAAEINKREWWHGAPYYGPTYADTAGARECAELNREHGIVTTPARKSRNPGLEHLRTLMLPTGPDRQPRLKIFSNCTNLVREIVGYRYPEGTTGRNPGDEPLDKDDHCLAAGTLVSCERGDVPIEQVTTQDRVWTRKGLRRVLWSGPTVYAPRIRLVTEKGYAIESSGEHRHWVQCQIRTPPGEASPRWMYAKDIGTDCFLLNRRQEVDRVKARIAIHEPALLYDLTVEGEHEFFANNFLTHNCIDALRYALYSDSVVNQSGGEVGRLRLLPEHERKGVRFVRR